jgi:threonine/homoserine/homoserine lactone efflux protein
MRIGVRLGPLSLSSSTRRGRSDGALGKAIATSLLVCFLVWPLAAWHTRHPVIAWIVEAAWAAFLLFIVFRMLRNQRERRAQSAAVELAEQQRLDGLRQQARLTNQPWLDPRLNSYVHGTCTIKHRSEGAAARCRSTV